MRRVVFLVVLAGCFYNDHSPVPEDLGNCTAPPDPSLGAAQPTWYKDVEPIVIEKCQGCHNDGGLAPFSLASYGQVAEVRDEIKAAITSNVMPPWQPSACCNHYKFDRSLTDDQRDTILRWLDQGLAMGDPGDAPPAMPPPAGLPRVDMRAQMAVPFTPMAKIGIDELRCFLLDHDPIDHTRYITGWDFEPGARPEVHHVIVLAVDEGSVGDLQAKDGADGRPGWDCYGGDGGEIFGGSAFIGGWQPGEVPTVLPDGVGRELPAHTRLVLQVHYDTGHGTAPDQSSLSMMLEDHVDRVERGIPVGNPLWLVGDAMVIPAGDPDAWVWFAYDPSDAITNRKTVELHKVMLHMHQLGSKGRVAIIHPDGSTECLLDIPAWNFHWMADYYFDPVVTLAPGDRVYVECHWDNSAENQPIINGEQQAPRTLHWGTDEEMCGGVLTYSEAL